MVKSQMMLDVEKVKIILKSKILLLNKFQSVLIPRSLKTLLFALESAIILIPLFLL